MKAVISGATGLVGSLLLPRLLADESITHVISFGRRKTGVNHSKLQEIVIESFHQLDQKTPTISGDIFFCCLGTTIKVAGSREKFFSVDHDAVLEFGQLAKSKNAKCFVVVTAAGANANSFIYYNRVKGQVENSLRGLALNRLVIFHPALLMGERKEVRVAERGFIKLAERLQAFLPEFLAKRAMTSAERLAARMLECALSPGPSDQTIEAAQI